MFDIKVGELKSSNIIVDVSVFSFQFCEVFLSIFFIFKKHEHI